MTQARIVRAKHQKYARPVADRMANLKRRAKKTRGPVVCVNDNVGHWRSNAMQLLEYCTR